MDGFQQAAVVKPINPLERFPLDRCHGFRGRLRQSVKSYVSGIAAVRLLCSEFGLRALFTECGPAAFCECRKTCPTWTAQTGPSNKAQRTATVSSKCIMLR
jgi:hypothetical protein